MNQHEHIIKMQKELENDFSITHCTTQQQLLNQLAASINQLINTDFTRLVNTLYRLDVNEKKLKQVLEQNAGADAGELIAALVIERQLEKQKSREQFKSSHDIPDDEKW